MHGNRVHGSIHFVASLRLTSVDGGFLAGAAGRFYGGGGCFWGLTARGGIGSLGRGGWGGSIWHLTAARQSVDGAL